jgi:hypothetical protein
MTTIFTRSDHNWLMHLRERHEAKYDKRVPERTRTRLWDLACEFWSSGGPVELDEHDTETLRKAKKVCDCPDIGNWRPA